MLLFFVYYLILFPFLTLAYPNYAQFKTYVEHHLNKNKNRQTNLHWLPNSNLIGIGYDPVKGSPACYTGTCQMDGFKHSIFELKYTSSRPGSCTNKTVPDNVQLLCLPSAALNAHTEEISTISQLQESTFQRIDVGATLYGWGILQGLFASYGYSKQTTYMANTITEKNQSLFHTTADIAFAKITMFEPMMQLSDNFRFVIDNMPCCVYDNDTKDYIISYIFDYFGFAYISELLLGGIVQEIVSINSERLAELKSKGLQTQHSVSVGYIIKLLGVDYSSNSTTTTQQDFRQSLTLTRISQLGGDPTKISRPIADWIKTVPDNPAVIKFKIRYLSNLMTSHRFPNDTNIKTKLMLMNRALNDYIENFLPKFCPQNCSGEERGICQWGDLKVPMCKCKPGYTGTDCSMSIPPDVPRGISCGFLSGGYLHIGCEGRNPRNNCPIGYSTMCFNDNIFKPGEVCTCYKLKTDKTKSKHGTICGIRGYCGGKHIPNEGCPHGYRFERNSVLCYKDDESIDDASGTACGYAAPSSSCGNDNSQLCPSGYTATMKSPGVLYYCSKL